jgi:hypothetical protein
MYLSAERQTPTNCQILIAPTPNQIANKNRQNIRWVMAAWRQSILKLRGLNDGLRPRKGTLQFVENDYVKFDNALQSEGATPGTKKEILASQQGDVCDVGIGLCREILKLPPMSAAMLLRDNFQQ